MKKILQVSAVLINVSVNLYISHYMLEKIEAKELVWFLWCAIIPLTIYIRYLGGISKD